MKYIPELEKRNFNNDGRDHNDTDPDADTGADVYVYIDNEEYYIKMTPETITIHSWSDSSYCH